MLTTKLTSKYQATVPLKIRRILGLKKGDSIAFELKNKKVAIRKATSLDIEYARSLSQTMDEWHSEFDETAYRGL